MFIVTFIEVPSKAAQEIRQRRARLLEYVAHAILVMRILKRVIAVAAAGWLIYAYISGMLSIKSGATTWARVVGFYHMARSSDLLDRWTLY